MLQHMGSYGHSHYACTDGHGQVGKAAARFVRRDAEVGEKTRQTALASLLCIATSGNFRSTISVSGRDLDRIGGRFLGNFGRGILHLENIDGIAALARTTL